MQLAFHFDQSRCIGCYACCISCKDWNDIPAGPANWRWVTHVEEGEFPNPYVAHVSQACNHCEKPLCAYTCPAGAITKREEDGIVVVDRDKCRTEARCGIITGYANGSNLSMGEREAPCQVTCPAHVKAPAYNRLIAKGYFTEALDLIRRNLPLPSVCGRICNHPCESECTRKDIDEPLAIAALKRFVADNVTEEKPQPLPRTKDQKVAIIGSGPAGLSAAYVLVKMGYGATIFEALPVAGGMLAVGIPQYRLPKKTLAKDIEYLTSLGVEIKTNTAIGPDLTLDELRQQGFAAFLIATGSHKAVKLPVPGIEKANPLMGVSFLKDVNLGRQVHVGKEVLVLGGGNVAFDCARTALRLGADEVHLACVESRKKMPAFPEEIEQAEQEGIIIHPSRTFTKILCEMGVKGVECLKLKSMRFDADGKLHVNAIPGSEHVLPCDTVIMAIGQAPDLGFLGVVGGLDVTKRGAISINEETMETSRPGIFACGDAVTCVGTAIEAIAAGQRAAIYMDRYLRGEVLGGEAGAKAVKASDIKIDIPSDVKKGPRARMPLAAAKSRAKTFNEVALGFDKEAARAEAERCLNCAGSLCLDVCPYGAPQFGAEPNAKMQKCNFCVDRWAENKPPICVAACIVRALDAGPVQELKKRHDVSFNQVMGFAYSPIAAPSTLFKPREKKCSSTQKIPQVY